MNVYHLTVNQGKITGQGLREAVGQFQATEYAPYTWFIRASSPDDILSRIQTMASHDSICLFPVNPQAMNVGFLPKTVSQFLEIQSKAA